MSAGFHGSYREREVTFLLKPLNLELISDIQEKERLIQSGQRHYSEILGLEHLPSAAYLSLFHEAVHHNVRRMARDLVILARRIRAVRPHQVTLVSLARAGTPIGVLLRYLLLELMQLDAPHYSISIVRDRGIDSNALDHILAHREASSLVFIDGWTAKGSITQELQRSLASFETTRGIKLPSELFVLSDLAGVAHACGTTQDYLIPSALLNATVSGLISRSVLNHQIGPQDFHGCVYYSQWLSTDLSQWFVQRVLSEGRNFYSQWLAEPLPNADLKEARQACTDLIKKVSVSHDVPDVNLIKPGIGESTRALLRRTPKLIRLRDPQAPEVRHLVQLAHERQVLLEVDPSQPLHAVALIRNLADG
ncbi:MAG: cysteine protease StiP domain-containing protein [Burkholderiales bacterium]|jgi:hypothetical protein